MTHLPPVPAQPLHAELCYPSPPTLDPDQLLGGVRAAVSGAELVWGGSTNLVLQLKPGTGAAGGALTSPRADAPGDPLAGPSGGVPGIGSTPIVVTVVLPGQPDGRARDLSQTWVWETAAPTLAAAPYTLSVVELLGRSHPRAERVQVFRSTIEVIMRLTSPPASWWPLSQLALPPDAFGRHPLTGLVNVRLFSHQSGGTIMDTLGLHTFGLPDMQCRSYDLDTGRLAGLLFDLARYSFDHGDVMETGHFVRGFGAQERWRVARQEALVGPTRPVIDLDPGER